MATKLKSHEVFSRKFGKDINELIITYIEAAFNYELTSAQKLCYFHNDIDKKKKGFTGTICNLIVTGLKKLV